MRFHGGKPLPAAGLPSARSASAPLRKRTQVSFADYAYACELLRAHGQYG